MKGLNEDPDKVQAIYNWITANIYFDQDAYDAENDSSEYMDASNVLSEKKALSGGISRLFHDLLAA